MKKILSTVLMACAFVACNAHAGELRVLAVTPTGDRAYVIPVDGAAAPTVNLAVPRNTQRLMIGYVADAQPEPVAMAPAPAFEKPKAEEVVAEPASAPESASTPAPVAAAPAEEPLVPAERVRPYLSAKAGFGFFKISNIAMTTRVPASDPGFISQGVAWLEDEAVTADGGNHPRGTYAYAAGLDVPVGFGSIRFEFEYNESDNHLYDLYGNSSTRPMFLTLSPLTRFFNLYWELPGFYRTDDGTTAVRPYIGAGFGTSAIRAHALWSDDSPLPDESFYTDTRVISRDKAYNYGAGLAFAVNRHVALDFGYRHVNYGKIRGTTENFFTLVDKDQGVGKPVSLSDVEMKTRANEFFGGIRLSI